MVGRAGRPQFDDEGVAVIMTSKDSTYRYQKMMAGQVRSGQLYIRWMRHNVQVLVVIGKPSMDCAGLLAC